jgi:hypothetical protein
MAARNIHLTGFSYNHYDFCAMKRVPSGISPVIAINKKVAKSCVLSKTSTGEKTA